MTVKIRNGGPLLPDLRKGQNLHFWYDFHQIRIEIFSYDYLQYEKRKEKFEIYVFDLVWNNHCDERSNIKSFSKLKKFDPISK